MLLIKILIQEKRCIAILKNIWHDSVGDSEWGWGLLPYTPILPSDLSAFDSLLFASGKLFAFQSQ